MAITCIPAAGRYVLLLSKANRTSRSSFKMTGPGVPVANFAAREAAIAAVGTDHGNLIEVDLHGNSVGRGALHPTRHLILLGMYADLDRDHPRVGDVSVFFGPGSSGA
jgi:hypothetical protein